MAENTPARIRRSIINSCLQSRRGYSMAEMMDKCKAELEALGWNPVTALNTIRADVRSIESEFDIEIEELRKGTGKRYRYADPNFSVYKAPITSNDIEKITELIETLANYEGRPQLEWLHDIRTALQMRTDTAMPERKSIVRFEENIDLEGRKHFEPLLNYIKNGVAIKITYKSFRKTEPTTMVTHPYFLRQYNNRWFLMAENDDSDRLSIYALDRIINMEESPVKYRPNNDRYDFEDYFYDIIGVSRPPHSEAESIELWVSAQQYPYIKTKPLHGTQTLIEDKGAEGAKIRIKVVPNFELEQMLLSFGEGVKVITPESLRQRIAERIGKMQELYTKTTSDNQTVKH